MEGQLRAGAVLVLGSHKNGAGFGAGSQGKVFSCRIGFPHLAAGTARLDGCDRVNGLSGECRKTGSFRAALQKKS